MKREIMSLLINWKNKKSKMPLIVKGARQVGKTYIIKEFGNNEYEDMVYVNFDQEENINNIFNDNITPKYIIDNLELYFHKRIIPGKTLIFFDEIQANERALNSLKYFCEEASEYDIIAAGSLLGVAINRDKYSFPVGKVEIMTMYPLGFKEFLMALGRDDLIKTIEVCYQNNQKMNLGVHNLALSLYRTFLAIGGYPAVVKKYLETNSILEASEMQYFILDSYVNDMTKYTSNSESNKIIATFDSIPTQLAKENQKFQYKIIQNGGTSSMFSSALSWLKNAGIINYCYKVNPLIPLEANKVLSSFKTYMADTGLLVCKGKYPLIQVNNENMSNYLSIGPLIENYVSTELVRNNYNLYYWESDATAEIDFLIQNGIEIIPIEVKSGINTKSRSLSVYMDKYHPQYGIRISEKNFGFVANIKSVPLYAIWNIRENK